MTWCDPHAFPALAGLGHSIRWQPLARTGSPGDAPAPQLWLMDLDGEGPRTLLDCLQPDEHARADRFHQALHARRFRHGRALLRHILAELCGLRPSEQRLMAGAHGKPFLAHQPGWRFNLSHSGRWALLITHERLELGIDLECHHDMPDRHQVAERIMGAAEFAAFSALPEAQHASAFLHCWTRKEALLKALGLGFMMEPDQIDLHGAMHLASQGGHQTLVHEGQAHHLRWQDVPLPADCPALACAAWLTSG